jgi:cytochrome b
LKQITLWSWPIRLFHWSLVFLLIGLWFSSSQGESGIHAQLGYAVLTLVIFRILWGFVGGTFTRFSHFVKGPSAVIAYFSGLRAGSNHPQYIGHNPAGGWMVVCLLLLLLVQGLLGLGSTDELLFEGPLAAFLGEELSLLVTTIHQTNFYIILGFVFIHVLAIVLYRWIKGDDLVHPMISGKKPVDDDVTISIDHRIRYVPYVAGAAILIVWLLVN